MNDDTTSEQTSSVLDEFENNKGYDKRMIKWTKWLNAKDKSELKEISKGDETMEITSNAILEFMKTQPKTLEEYYEGKLEEEIQRNIYMTEKELNEKYVLSMIKNNEHIEKIQLYSGLDKDKIKSIAKKNNINIDDH